MKQQTADKIHDEIEKRVVIGGDFAVIGMYEIKHFLNSLVVEDEGLSKSAIMDIEQTDGYSLPLVEDAGLEQRCWDNGVEWCRMHHPETWKSKYQIALAVVKEFIEEHDEARTIFELEAIAMLSLLCKWIDHQEEHARPTS